MPDFLLEIGCEEIPARMLPEAEAQLRQKASALIETLGLHVFTEGDAKAFTTPRRIAIQVPGLIAGQHSNPETIMGPSVKVAYKEGTPTPALEAFAKKVGKPSAQLEKIQTPKGEYVASKGIKEGRPTKDLLSEQLPKEISSIYWPKNMYWRAGAPERFVRPIRWIVAMLDGEVMPLAFAGVKAGNTSRGHRFFSDGVKIGNAADYESALEKAKVIVSVKKREEKIRKALDAATRTVPGARWREDETLLDTVVNLTEWPGVILGSFEREYLVLPEEVLVTVMRDHQKYFAVEDASGRLAPHFLAVLNTDGDPEGLIQHGNERVLRARFNDARFFWQTDQKVPLKQRIDMLKAVTFQKDLGSYYEKTERVRKLAENIAEDLVDLKELDPAVVGEAAWHAKADLTTELVKEFTELQGVVGGLYARAQGLGEPVAQAIYDQYKPESMDDDVPRTLEGAVLSIADKADTIAGMFALGLQPTGSKDPFALRRQANGIVRILAEHKLKSSLSVILLRARNGYKETPSASRFIDQDKYVTAVSEFFKERLAFYLRDALGFSYDVVSAVMAAPGFDDVADTAERVCAVSTVKSLPDFESISIAFKRIRNILEQAKQQGYTVPAGIADTNEGEQGEVELKQTILGILPQYKSAVKDRHYPLALSEMAKLRKPIDEFFEKVMIMHKDPVVRERRLGLLYTLKYQFSRIADFSEIVTEGKTS